MMKKAVIIVILLCSVVNGINAQEKLKLDIEKSSIIWEGSKLFGFGNHDGTVNFKEGEVIVKESKITKGSFIINISFRSL